MKFQVEVIRVKFNKEDFRKELGANLRKLREEKSLTQSDVADSISLSRTAYVNIEQGRQGLKIEYLIKIGVLLKVELSEILPKLFDEAK